MAEHPSGLPGISARRQEQSKAALLAGITVQPAPLEKPKPFFIDVALTANENGNYPSRVEIQNHQLNLYYEGSTTPSGMIDMTPPGGRDDKDRILRLIVPVDDLAERQVTGEGMGQAILPEKCNPRIEIEQCRFNEIQMYTKAFHKDAKSGTDQREYEREIDVELKSKDIDAKLRLDGRGDTVFALNGVTQEEAEGLKTRMVMHGGKLATATAPELAKPFPMLTKVLDQLREPEAITIGERPTQILHSVQQNAVIRQPENMDFRLYDISNGTMENVLDQILTGKTEQASVDRPLGSEQVAALLQDLHNEPAMPMKALSRLTGPSIKI